MAVSNKIYSIDLLHQSFILHVSILITFAIFLSACGKKTSPVPPLQIQAPSVKDLRANTEGRILKLSWSVPPGKGKSAAAGFVIYRSKKALTEVYCETCPILFNRIADIPAEGIGGEGIPSNNGVYFETLEKGYRYIYKVTVYTKSGAVSGDSNYVNFTF